MSGKKHIFSPTQRQLLTHVLNRITPVTDILPGEGDLGLTAYFEDIAASTPGLTRLFNDGLDRIFLAAGKASAGGFEALSNAAKDDILRSIETAHPTFFDQLVLQTYNAYNTNTEVFDLIGHTLPQLAASGSTPELLDSPLLDEQREWKPFWTTV